METMEGPAAPPETEAPKKLRRSRSDRWIAGVCGGLSEYFGLNAAVYRVLFVALAFAGGTGLVLYVAAALVMPAEDREDSVLTEVLARHRDRPWLVIGMALLALVLAFAFTGPGPEGVFWPGAVAFWLFVAFAIVVVAWAARGGRRRVVTSLVVLAVLVAAAIVGAISLAVSLGVTEERARPTHVGQLEDRYELRAGELVLDLRSLELPEGETRVEARVGWGELEVIVPDDVVVSATGRARWGEVEVLGRGDEGRDVREAALDPGFDDASTRLVVDARVRGGEVRIHR